MAEGPGYSYSLRLTAFPDGHLAVTLHRDDDTLPLEAEFQRVDLAANSTVLALLSVKDEQVALKVGFTELGPYRAEDEPLNIQRRPVPTRE